MLLFQFEYQQATLEAEVENLSWKVERAEITDRGVRVGWIEGGDHRPRGKGRVNRGWRSQTEG